MKLKLYLKSPPLTKSNWIGVLLNIYLGGLYVALKMCGLRFPEIVSKCINSGVFCVSNLNVISKYFYILTPYLFYFVLSLFLCLLKALFLLGYRNIYLVLQYFIIFPKKFRKYLGLVKICQSEYIFHDPCLNYSIYLVVLQSS